MGGWLPRVAVRGQDHHNSTEGEARSRIPPDVGCANLCMIKTLEFPLDYIGPDR